ncbi:MAG: hypothetical protein KC501_36930 [Myxococcales bacterium]|nr:hypothetical protein [Myxococcales bacterium]
MLASLASLASPPAPTEPPPSDAPSPARATFTPGKGIRWSSEDGRSALSVGLFTHVLGTVEHDEADDADDADPPTTLALELRRARLLLGGHFLGPHNRFGVQLAFSPRDLQMRDGRPTKTPIFDWTLELDQIPDLVFRVGQFRVPWSRERRIPIGKIMMADRSMPNFELNLDRDVGMSLRSPDFMGWGWLRYELGLFVGEGRDAYQPDGTGLLYVARVELLPLGMFEDYDETDRERSPRPRLSLGGAYAFLADAKGNRGILGSAPTDGGTTNIHAVTADVVLKVAGVTVLGEGYWRRGIRDYGSATIDDPMLGPIPAPLEAPRDGGGLFAQVGWLVPRIPLELGTRYGLVRPSRRRESSMPSRDEVAASVGWLVRGPALKLVADYAHEWPGGSGSADGLHRVRLQLQAAF